MPAGHRPPARPAAGARSASNAKPAKGDSWAQRVLREPRFGLAGLIGAVVGTPGASYITALHQLIASKTSTVIQALAVVIFAIIEFTLVIVPYALLELRPDSPAQSAGLVRLS